MFYTAREVNFKINGKEIFCNGLSLQQQADLSSPILEQEAISTRNISNAPKTTRLTLNYYLTGRCPLKDYCLTSHKFPLSGRINDNLQFNFGYLQSYKLSAAPNSPINIAAEIFVVDEISGSLSSITSATPPENLSIWNYNDASFSNNALNITNFEWEFRNEIEGIYYQKETGLSIINPDRVFIGAKTISANIVSDSENLILGFTGSPFSIDLTCRHPSQNITEVYSVSGMINAKDFSVSSRGLSQTSYSISQSHVNEEPKINTVDISTYPSNNYILINSPNLTNGYFSSNNNFPLVERVTLAGRELRFSVARGASFDTITGYIHPDAINGALMVSTTKGLVIYPSTVSLNFSGIGVSGFYPITGSEHESILITGKNFYRISNVKINNKDCNFIVFDSTGSYHQIRAYVPNDPRIGKISVHSFLRNSSGFSTGNFYPAMSISQFTPTGTWSGICIISGKNFSGITNVYFNKIKSPNFTVNNNEQITARLPITGAGFPKGYLTVSGFQGMSVQSRTQYQPILKITGISTISGRPENDIAISGIFDSGYLYFESGGYRVSFGDTYSIFLRSGGVDDFVLTGYMPFDSFSSAKPAMVEPDGITKYTPFTGSFLQIAKPVVYTVNDIQDNYTTKLYHSEDLIIKGSNFDYLFGTPYFVIISGWGHGGAAGTQYSTDIITTYTDVESSVDGNSLLVKNVRMTGNIFKEHILAKLGVVNVAGTGWFPGHLWFNNSIDRKTPVYSLFFDEAHLRTYTYGKWNPPKDFPANIAITNYNEKTAAFSRRFGNPTYDDGKGYAVTSTIGFVDFLFSPVINFGGILVYQSLSLNANDNGYLFANPIPYTQEEVRYYPIGQQHLLAQTGTVQVYTAGDGGTFVSSLITGINFSNSRFVVTKSFSNREMQTGVAKIRIYRDDVPLLNRYFAFTHIDFFG